MSICSLNLKDRKLLNLEKKCFSENIWLLLTFKNCSLLSCLVSFSWDPSISVQEILFCIQQLLTHPNHRGLYDPEEYRENVRLQAEKYSYENGSDFLEKAMVGLQAKIDPAYKMPLQPWEHVRWENLEEVRWKGIRSFQSRKASNNVHRHSDSNQHMDTNLVENVENHVVQEAENEIEQNDDEEVAELDINNYLSLSDIDENEENDENNNNEIETVGSPNGRSVLAPIANANSSELSPTRQLMPTGHLRDEDGKVCACSCCEQGSRQFLDSQHKMRYFFGEGS